MNRCFLILSLTACALIQAPARAQSHSVASPQAEIIDITVKASPFVSADVTVPVHVFKPTPTTPKANAGPWPVVIFSHGRSGTAAARAAFKTPLPADSDPLRYWHSKGYAVVTAVRPGYGDNTADDPEDHGIRWSGNACTGSADFGKTAGAAAHAMRSVHNWVLEQEWAIKDRILLVGQSVGGLTTVAACGQNWPGVVGCINFAGGAGGNPDLSPGTSCRAERLKEQLASAARTTAVPTLWLYSANDKFWGEDAPKQWHSAFRQAAAGAGQKVESEFFAAPPVGQNGHALHLSGSRFWIPAVNAWMQKHGF